MSTAPLIPARFFFRFAAPCLHTEKFWGRGGLQLGPEYRLADFAELEGRRTFADVRVGWSAAGLTINVRVEGKRQRPWCRESRLDDSDGLQLWIDTRDTHSIHRAGRFCHRFVFLPFGGGRDLSLPFADQLLVDRARENAKPVRPEVLSARSEKRVNGYLLEAFVPAAALTGYDPAEYPRLGFTYAVLDRELGEQTFSVGSELPYPADPSLWGTLELVGKK